MRASKGIQKILRSHLFFLFLSLLFIFSIQFGMADQKPKSRSQKVIDFEDDLVEGMNKKPYDSLNQVSEAKKKRKTSHLYHKRKGFRVEMTQTVRKMRYSQ